MESSTNTTFRSQIEPAQAPEPVTVNDNTVGQMKSTVEVPYTDYEREHNHPFPVDFFDLGDRWDDPQGGYSEEVSIIEEYFKNRIENGEMANTRKAVERQIKDILKMNNIKDEERLPVKMGILSAYMKFLMEVDGVNFNAKKYGHTK